MGRCVLERKGKRCLFFQNVNLRCITEYYQSDQAGLRCRINNFKILLSYKTDLFLTPASNPARVNSKLCTLIHSESRSDGGCSCIPTSPDGQHDSKGIWLPYSGSHVNDLKNFSHFHGKICIWLALWGRRIQRGAGLPHSSKGRRVSMNNFNTFQNM